MKTLTRIAVALAALLVAAFAALAILLPRLAASDAVHSKLIEEVRRVTKREFAYGELEAGLVPPRLVLKDATLSGDAEGPAVSAHSAELRLAVLPLLARAVVVRSLVLEGASARVERTAHGMRLAGEDLAEPPKPPKEERSDTEKARHEGLALAIQRIVLRGAALRLDDRTLDPAPRIELANVEGEARASAPDAPLEIALRAALASGGTLQLEGDLVRGGPFDLRAKLDGVELAAFAPYANGAHLAARASGDVAAAGKRSRPERAKLDLRLDAEDLGSGSLAAHGPLTLHAELAGDPAAPSGPFELDATQGELSFGKAVRKPAGLPATAHGTLRREKGPSGAIVKLDAVEIALGAVHATGAFELSPSRRVTLDAPPFDAAALAALVPALEERGVSGKLALEGLAIETEPLAVRGRVTFDPLATARGGNDPIALRGALEGRGGEIVGDGLRAKISGQEVPIDLRVIDLKSRPRFELAAKADDLDSSTLLGALTGDRDRLSGPLDFDAHLSGPAGGSGALAALAGDVSLNIAPGRLHKVSLLQEAFEAAGAKNARKNGALAKSYGDEFESLSGHFHVAGGAARTDDLRLVYGDYTAELRGSLGLADRALDLQGSLHVDADLSDASGIAGRTIPLASVRGTIDDPEVALSHEALAGIAAAYAGDPKRREKWEHKLDERLGDGRGKDVLQALDKMLEALQEPKKQPEDGVGTEPPQ